jgi:transcriptional regulator with XRE-family HTH domain
MAKTQTPLKNLRIARTLKQEQMASLLEISQQTYARYESGEVVPSVDRQARIAAILGASVETLWPQAEQVAL